MTALKTVLWVVVFLASVTLAASGGYFFAARVPSAGSPANLKTGGPVKSISKTVIGKVTQVQGQSIIVEKDGQSITISTSQARIIPNSSAREIKRDQQVIIVQEIQPNGTFLTTTVRIL